MVPRIVLGFSRGNRHGGLHLRLRPRSRPRRPAAQGQFRHVPAARLHLCAAFPLPPRRRCASATSAFGTWRKTPTSTNATEAPSTAPSASAPTRRPRSSASTAPPTARKRPGNHLLERGLESLLPPRRPRPAAGVRRRRDGRTRAALEPAEADGRFRCDPERLSQPIGAWPNRNALQPVLVNMGQTIRWFVWPLPRPDSFIDLASTRQVLENLQRIAVSQELYDDLVGQLGHDRPRRPRARRCTASVCKRCSTRRCRPASSWKRACRCCSPTRRMQEAIEQYKHQVGEEYRKELEKQEDAAGRRGGGAEGEEAGRRGRRSTRCASGSPRRRRGSSRRRRRWPRPSSPAPARRSRKSTGSWPRWRCCGRS